MLSDQELGTAVQMSKLYSNDSIFHSLGKTSNSLIKVSKPTFYYV